MRFHWRHSPTTQSQCSIVDFQHVCPLQNSLFQLWTHGSFIWRPSLYTARSGMNSVPLFCKFPPHWWRLLLPLFRFHCRPASFTFAGACVQLRNQFVVGGPRRRDYSALPAVFGLSHSRRRWTQFEVYTHNLQGSSQSKQRAVECSQFTGK